MVREVVNGFHGMKDVILLVKIQRIVQHMKIFREDYVNISTSTPKVRELVSTGIVTQVTGSHSTMTLQHTIQEEPKPKTSQSESHLVPKES